MTANRLRALPWVLGVCLVALSLVGANKLLDPTRSDKTVAPPSGPPLDGGVIVLGTVDSDPPPVRVGPPGVGMQLTATKVFVADGDVVQDGAPLVQFDDSIFQAKLKEAQAGLAAAAEDKAKAEVAKKVHAITLVRQQDAIKQAQDELTTAEEALRLGREKLEKILGIEKDLTTLQPLTEVQKRERREKDLELLQAAARASGQKAKLEDERKKLEALQLDPVDADIKRAEAQVRAMEAKIQEAQAAVNMCQVKALRAGVVEHVFAAPGMTFGPSTREPLLWLIPDGGRVVRAEVEAEFAYKVADKVGARVTVYDHNNFALTYPGVVKRVGTAFLPKRTVSDAIVVNPSRVLECLIEVTGPAPVGKAPLRVGQPVRVSFGQ